MASSGKPFRGIDPDTLAKLQQSRTDKTTNLELKPTAKLEEPKIDPVAAFLKQAPTIEADGVLNRKLFSEVFGFKPVNMEDFLVPSYEPDYWDSAVKEMIPVRNSEYVLDSKTVTEVMYALSYGDTTLVHGPTGTGKTSILKECAAICGIPFHRVSCHGQMEISEFVGANSVVNDEGVSITQHSDTDTTLAAKYGGLLCIDEVFRAPSTALMSLQSLLESPHELHLQDAHGNARNIEVPQSDFFLMLTDNTTGVGDTTGNFTAEVQDTSTRNRIRRAIYIDYLPIEHELQIVKLAHPEIPEPLARNMIQVVNLVRDAFKSGSCLETMSIRELLTWAQDLMVYRDVKRSFTSSFVNKLTPDDKGVVLDIYKQVFKS